MGLLLASNAVRLPSPALWAIFNVGCTTNGLMRPFWRPPMFGNRSAFFTDVGHGVGACPYSP